MKKGVKVKEVVTVEDVTVGVVATQEETKKLGRPIDPNSPRQQRLKEIEERRANGEVKKGRPIKEGSNRQLRLVELELKRANGELRKGRPVNSESKRQQRISDLESRRANGTLKLGRPKMVKEETEK